MKPTSSFNRFKTLIVASGRILRTVEITFNSATAGTMMLLADFVSSHFPPLPMKTDTHGVWRIQLRLAPGCSRYQFVVDGRMIDDPQACGVMPLTSGSCDCMVGVE